MIAFKHPEFLFFLFAIIIPIVIHLFSFRKYKKVYFHNIQFIKNIQTEQNSSKSKLKELLILAARIGMITFLVVAFAQPYIPRNNAQQTTANSAVAIYIDNSFSTQSESANGIVLEFEKKKAQEITDAYSAETKFFLFSNTANPTEQFARTRDEIKNDISALTTSPNQLTINEISKKLQTCAQKNNTKLTCHILSDFQKYAFDFKNIESDSTLSVNLYPIENQRIPNISIDSCYFETPHHITNSTEKITVTISNNSDEIFNNFPVKIFINDTMRAMTSVVLKPHSKISVPIEYNTKETGIISGKIEIEDYPILYDNAYFFSYYVENQINILNLYENAPNRHIAALCKNEPSFLIENQSIKNIDYSTLTNYPVIILDRLSSIPAGLVDEINKFKSVGKTIVCIPSDNIEIASYNRLLALFGRQQITQKDSISTTIETIDANNAIFKNVFEPNQQNPNYPEIYLHYQIEPQTNNAIVSLRNNQPFLTQQSKGKSTLFTFSSPLDEKNGTFVASPLFVGLHNMFLSVSTSNEPATILGENTELVISKPLNDEALHIENATKSIDVIPQYRTDIQTSKLIVNSMQQISEAGNYIITQKKEPIIGISYNYNRAESNLEFYSPDEIEDFIQTQPQFNLLDIEKEITQEIKDLTTGTQLWRFSLLLAILFVAMEIFVITTFDKLMRKSSSKIAETEQKTTTFVNE